MAEARKAGEVRDWGREAEEAVRRGRVPAGDCLTYGTELARVLFGLTPADSGTITLNGRIDQLLRLPTALTLREIKTVTRPLPVDETELRRDYPGYFTQLATYVALARLGALGPLGTTFSAQLVFVETASGLAQTLPLSPADEHLFRVKLERIVEFLDLRLRARERLRHLAYRPAFATPRPGQETTAAELTTAFERHPAILFEAPTGFGKTGVLLEFALGQLRSGHFDRALYLTSKATGQLQVVRTLTAMTADAPFPQLSTLNSQPATSVAVTAWHVRNKSEHCVNHTFHCHRDSCAYLADLETRWASSGLSRFYLLENQAHDLPALRAAGQHDVGVIVANHPRGIANRMGAGGAGGDHRVVGALQAEFD